MKEVKNTAPAVQAADKGLSEATISQPPSQVTDLADASFSSSQPQSPELSRLKHILSQILDPDSLQYKALVQSFNLDGEGERSPAELALALGTGNTRKALDVVHEGLRALRNGNISGKA